MSGIFYAVGVGPGDPELITLKAIRILQECDMIGIPGNDSNNCYAYQTVLQAAPDLTSKPILRLPAPMTKDMQILERSYVENTGLVCAHLEQGLKIAAVTIGDPSIYSAAYTLLCRVRERGYATEMISGVPSFCAAACTLQESLGERDEAIHILPGSYAPEESLQLDGKKVIMKSGKSYVNLKQFLLNGGYTAMLAENCGRPGEKLYRSIQEFPELSPYLSLMIVK